MDGHGQEEPADRGGGIRKCTERCEDHGISPDEKYIGNGCTDNWARTKLETQRCDGKYSFPVYEEEFLDKYREYRKLLHEEERLIRRYKIALGQGHEVKKAKEYTRVDFLDQIHETFGGLCATLGNSEFENFYDAFVQAKLEQIQQWEEEESQVLFRDSEAKLDLHYRDLQNLQGVELKLEKIKKLFGGQIHRCSLDPALNGGSNWIMLPGSPVEDLAAFKQHDSSIQELNNGVPDTKLILYPVLYFSALDEPSAKQIISHQIQVLLAVHDGILRLTDIEKCHKNLFGYEILELIKNECDSVSVFPTLFKSFEDLITEILSVQPGLGIQVCDVTIGYDPGTDTFAQEKYFIQKPGGNKPMSGRMRAIVEDKLNLNSLANANTQQSKRTTPGNQLASVGMEVMRQFAEGQDELDPEEVARQQKAEEKAQKLADELILKLGPTIPVIPRTFVQPGEAPNLVSWCIKEGQYVRGMIFDPVNPCKMFVILTQFWDELELYQREIQKRMDTILLNLERRAEATVPHVSMLEPGLFVMVYCTCGATEWFRARVRFVESWEPPIIHVQLADFGCFEVIQEMKYIKFMRRDIFVDFQHQMIECKLHFRKKVCADDRYPIWDPAMDFKSFTIDRPMGIYFRNKVYFKNPDDSEVWNNEYIWIVTMNRLNKGKSDSSDHTKEEDFTDVYNPYLGSEIGVELQRRAAKKKRFHPGGDGQPVNAAETQNISDLEMYNLHEHGEFLCKVEVYDISNVVEKYIIGVVKPKRIRKMAAARPSKDIKDDVYKPGGDANRQAEPLQFDDALCSALSAFEMQEIESGVSVTESSQQPTTTNTNTAEAKACDFSVGKTLAISSRRSPDRRTEQMRVPGTRGRERARLLKLSAIFSDLQRCGRGRARARQDSDSDSDHTLVGLPTGAADVH